MPSMTVWPTDAADGSVATEARWRKMGRLWTATGVIQGVGGELAPTLAFPNLTVQSGAVWIDGHYGELAGAQVLTVTANGLVVVRFDPAANTCELLYRDGAAQPTQNPVGVWEIAIAQIVGSAMIDTRERTGSTPMQPGKNWALNGAFNINQRAMGAITATGFYVNDRWVPSISDGVGQQFVVSPMTPSQAIAGHPFKNFLAISGTLSNPAGSGYLYVEQAIEDVRTLNGQLVTISFWAMTATTGTIGARLVQVFDNGGVGDTNMTGQGATVTANGQWQRVSVNYRLPPVGSKVIGPDSRLLLIIDKLIGTAVGIPGSITGQVLITGVQVEAGPVPTPYEHKPYAVELAECQRFYERITGTGTSTANMLFAVGQVTGSTGSFCLITYRTKRRLPTIYVATPSAFFVPDQIDSNHKVCSGIGGLHTGLERSGLNISHASGLIAGQAMRLHASGTGPADIEIIAEY